MVAWFVLMRGSFKQIALPMKQVNAAEAKILEANHFNP
jgi:hypothetical protein